MPGYLATPMDRNCDGRALWSGASLRRIAFTIAEEPLQFCAMVMHSQERFKTIVAGLNQAFDGLMVFELVGSLTDRSASQHDADIVVYPKLPFDMKAFSKGCKDARMEIVAVDKTSTTPFPGRPQGQDRIQVKISSGEVIDLFFPKGSAN